MGQSNARRAREKTPGCWARPHAPAHELNRRDDFEAERAARADGRSTAPGSSDAAGGLNRPRPLLLTSRRHRRRTSRSATLLADDAEPRQSGRYGSPCGTTVPREHVLALHQPPGNRGSAVGFPDVHGASREVPPPAGYGLSDLPRARGERVRLIAGHLSPVRRTRAVNTIDRPPPHRFCCARSIVVIGTSTRALSASFVLRLPLGTQARMLRGS